MPPSGDTRLQRLRHVKRRELMRGRRISRSRVVEGTWNVNDIKDIRWRSGIDVKDAKLHPVELRRSN